MAEDSAPAAPLDGFRADRLYLGADHARNERRTRIATAVCAVSLVVQVAGGLLYNSMALTAAGLHMAAHVAVLLTATLAYTFARRYAADPRFSFGTGKLGYLAGFANAVALAGTALLIGLESVERLIHPEAVEYGSALWIALFGLAVNLFTAILIRPGNHGHEHDVNIGAAYLHLTADVIVSVLALAGLYAGRRLGWGWADPVAGVLGAILVARFAWDLIRKAAAVLLDMNPGEALTEEIRRRLAAPGERLIDLHVWRLGPGHDAALAVIAAAEPQDPQVYRARLADLPGLSHVTVEVRQA
ncbi:MAG: cation diffusion facilitator family transporter [Parcubacteria group bacterium]